MLRSIAKRAPQRFLESFTTESANLSKKTFCWVVEKEKSLLLPRRASAFRNSGWKMINKAKAKTAAALLTIHSITLSSNNWEIRVRIITTTAKPTKIRAPRVTRKMR